MAKTSTPRSPSKPPRRPPPGQATRFVVCRTINGYWIASTKGGRVTSAFPVAHEAARFAARHLPRGSIVRPEPAETKRRP